MSSRNTKYLSAFITAQPTHGLDEKLLYVISEQFSLDLDGIHGVYHWHRVYKNALKLASYYKIESNIFMLFALFHDSKRANDNIDPSHGSRGAKYARSLQHEFSELQELSEKEFNILEYACSSHTKIDFHNSLMNNLIANICWDADRLDIGRVGFDVNPDYLSTDYAKELVCGVA